MPSSSADAQTLQPRRPPPMARTNSTTSQISQSPSESLHHKAPKAPRQHVVGGGRMQRNTSTGKNLNKLTKLNQAHAHALAQAGADANTAKHHRRAHSGSNPVSAPSSPRPSFKRHASSGAIVRAVNQGHGHGHANIRKNHSSGHLARQAKPALKSSKSEMAAAKRSLVNPGKVRPPSPEHPAVHFDVGDEEEDEEGQEDGWTEESASQSPNTTRSNTRSNSIVLDSHKMAESGPQRHTTTTAPAVGGGPAPPAVTNTQQQQQTASPPPSTHSQTLPDRTNHSRQSNGSNAQTHSRPPDADMITSRLLQRSSHQNAPPQMSSIAATVVPSYSGVREFGQSAGSTLVDTPGRDLVSRFIEGDGSVGTPNNSSFLPSRNSPQTGAGTDADRIKRNKSMPNVAGGDAPSPPPAKAQHRRTGTGTSTDLPPSRTQQKLMLQRASSNIEPQKLIPVILPRTGAPPYINSGMTYTSNNEGRLDPRLQQQFNHVAVEYSVVRRYRNPLADAIKRIEKIPGTPRKTRVPRAATANGHTQSTQGSASGSLSASFNEDIEGRRSRASLENGRDRDSDDAEGRQSFESDGGVRNEAEEICRRLWESSEAVEGD